MELWYRIVETVLPFAWAEYTFMKNALLAVLIAAPLFALIGTVVVNNRMTFFSDVLGHATLTGIGIGTILGLGDPLWAMVVFGVLFAVAVIFFKAATESASDAVLGVFFAAVVSLGVVLLSRGGSFAKFTPYLVGDILAVTPARLASLALIAILVALYWVFFANSLILTGTNPSLARSRGIAVRLVEMSFAALLAVVVTVSVRLVGILVINGLLIVPAAAARNVARSVFSYTVWALAIGTVSGIAGLIVSYYSGTAAGATIVLIATLGYVMTAGLRMCTVRR